MLKVAYNACYGGFGLSREAMNRLAELGVEGINDNLKLNEEVFKDYPNIKKQFSIWDMPRHDRRLIQVIEELGEKANGAYAKLNIELIKGNKYRINEYDGMEDVQVPEDIKWVVVED